MLSFRALSDIFCSRALIVILRRRDCEAGSARPRFAVWRAWPRGRLTPIPNHQSRQGHPETEKPCGDTIRCVDSMDRARCKILAGQIQKYLAVRSVSSRIANGKVDVRFSTGWLDRR